jgi:hypothetical protein
MNKVELKKVSEDVVCEVTTTTLNGKTTTRAVAFTREQLNQMLANATAGVEKVQEKIDVLTE